MTAPTIKLNNGLDMPIFGLGTYLVNINKFHHQFINIYKLINVEQRIQWI